MGGCLDQCSIVGSCWWPHPHHILLFGMLSLREWLLLSYVVPDEIRIMILRAVFAEDKYSFSTRTNEDINEGMTVVCTIWLQVNHTKPRWVDAKERWFSISYLIMHWNHEYGSYIQSLLSFAHRPHCTGTRSASYSANAYTKYHLSGHLWTGQKCLISNLATLTLLYESSHGTTERETPIALAWGYPKNVVCQHTLLRCYETEITI